MNDTPKRDIFRVVLTLTLMGGLIGLSLWIVRPFTLSILWATAIAVATWPMLVGLQRRVGGRRWLAVAVMTLTLLLIFVVPVSLAIGAIIRHVDEIAGWAKSLETYAMGEPPTWLGSVPLAGESLEAGWRSLAASDNLTAKISPYLGSVTKWFVAQMGGLGAVAGQLLLTVAIAGIFFARGETAARGLLLLARRLSAEHGEDSVRLAAQAIRGVALGVVVTALIQSLLAGLGLAIVRVPFAGVLTAVMFMLAVAQIGVIPVLACAVIWKYTQGDAGWATALLVWTVIVGSIDNVIRPILIRKGADLPLLLIFAGVIGGLISFGLVGIFIGPVVLAVTWKLFSAWVKDAHHAPAVVPPEQGATPTTTT